MKSLAKSYILVLFIFTIMGCSKNKNIEHSEQLGRRDALEALVGKSDKEREHGILEIRTKEQMLREKNLNECADAYIAGAFSVIDSILKENELY